MTLLGRVAEWKYWDAAALLAAMLVSTGLLLAYEGIPERAGWIVFGGALLMYAFGSVVSWRQGDARLAATGGLLIVIAFTFSLPAIILLVACLMGDCV